LAVRPSSISPAGLNISGALSASEGDAEDIIRAMQHMSHLGEEDD
jgi:hypothetical protein